MTIHHGTGTILFEIWRGMKGRCNVPSNTIYKYYGGRGIKVCEEWYKYTAFKDWALSNGYEDDLSLDRIDVNGHYQPDNCRWVSKKEQANNTRANVYVKYNGETKTLAQWADAAGLNYHTFYCRLKRGWTFERALLEAVANDRNN